ncbi:MAG: BatA domain-containing protein, partial [Rhodomicrobium sp.]
MMPGLLSSLTFTAPWMLMGLAVLPVIWWLLRLTPPRPETVAFPPTSLLLGLKARERMPIRSPWWLTALRMLVAAAVIAALAGPLIKPPANASTAVTQPLLVVVDNGWAAGSRWPARQAFAEQLAALADDSGQTLILAATAGPAAPLQLLTPAEFRQHFASLTPQPYPGDRAALAQQIEKELGSRRGN